MSGGRSLYVLSTDRSQHLIAVECRKEREWKKREIGQSAEA